MSIVLVCQKESVLRSSRVLSTRVTGRQTIFRVTCIKNYERVRVLAYVHINAVIIFWLSFFIFIVMQ